MDLSLNLSKSPLIIFSLPGDVLPPGSPIWVEGTNIIQVPQADLGITLNFFLASEFRESGLTNFVSSTSLISISSPLHFVTCIVSCFYSYLLQLTLQSAS